ncbi:hypothetical protein ACN4EG_14075 [Alkalinema pantanalense CENA528]|uniref:hypothetical protein n=1 Tax=Alkalinema pantanalense TaxID=1620705 RepID=UPI003D6ED530
MAKWFNLSSLVFQQLAAIVMLGSAMASSSQAAVTYKLDDIGGDTVPEDLYPLGLVPIDAYKGNIVGDLMWMNSYQVEEGGDLLKSISLTWGAPGLWAGYTGLSDWQTRPYPISLFLYSDPNNDGRPDDAQILAQAETTITNPDSLTFTTVDIKPTQLEVGRHFFVGALFRNHLRGQLPATVDSFNSVDNRSWYVIANHGDDQPSNFDAVNLNNNFRKPTPLEPGAGNWVLRVNGVATQPPRKVPESGAGLALLGVGAWLLGRTVSHRAR